MKKTSPLMIERKLVNFNLDAVYNFKSVTQCSSVLYHLPS